MTKATQYVNHMYSLYEGRAAVTVGVNHELETIHPFVFENENKMPIGLIAMSENGVTGPVDVDLYHISSFVSGRGQGTEILNFLCKAADDIGVRLCIQATAQQSGKQSMKDADLVCWYRKFGFRGSDVMYRESLVSATQLTHV